MGKTMALTEEVHRDLKKKAYGMDASMGAAVALLSKIADQRVKIAFKDGTVPMPEGVGIPLLAIYSGLHLLDCGIISKKLFQAIIKNFEKAGIIFTGMVTFGLERSTKYAEAFELDFERSGWDTSDFSFDLEDIEAIERGEGLPK
jgi:hypothetical protein